MDKFTAPELAVFECKLHYHLTGEEPRETGWLETRRMDWSDGFLNGTPGEVVESHQKPGL